MLGLAGKVGAMTAAFGAALVAVAMPRFAAAQEAQPTAIYVCSFFNRNDYQFYYSVVETSVPLPEVGRQYAEMASSRSSVPDAACRDDWSKPFQSKAQADGLMRQHYRDAYVDAWKVHSEAWTPREIPVRASNRSRVVVNLASPDTQKGERGFGGLAFDLEYEFLECFGELHIAYSLVENSVRARPDSTMPPVYLLEGKYHVPAARPSQIVSVPIRGSVATRQAKAIGKFADDFAAKALGFGCFSGQSKKLGMMKDYLAADATELQVKDFLNSLVAFVETPEVYQFGAAEDEIRTFLREHPEADTLNAGSKQQIARMQRERELAEVRAREEAEAAAEAKRLAEERQKAFAEQTARAKAAADKTLAEQKAVEQYQRDKTAHEAELARLAEEKAKYDAEMVEVARKRAEYDKAMEEYRARIAAGAKPAS